MTSAAAMAGGPPCRCSGILYHLDAPDVFRFVRRIYEVCSRLAIIDTQIALRPGVALEFEGAVYHGMWHQEHDESADADTKLKDLHASVENTQRRFQLVL